MKEKKLMKNITKGSLNLFLALALLVGGVVAEENVIIEETGITEEDVTITEDTTIEESEVIEEDVTIEENEITEENVVTDEIESNVPEMNLEEGKGTEDKMYQERVAESELVVDEQEGNRSIIFDAATKTYFMGDYAMQDYIDGSVDLATLQSGEYNQNTKIIVNGVITLYTINGEVTVNSIEERDVNSTLKIFVASNLKVETNSSTGIAVNRLDIGDTEAYSLNSAIAETTTLQVKAKEIGMLVKGFNFEYMDLTIEAGQLGITSTREATTLWSSPNEEDYGYMRSRSNAATSKMNMKITGDDARGIQMSTINIAGKIEFDISVENGVGILTDELIQSRYLMERGHFGYLKVKVNQGEGIVALSMINLDETNIDIQVEDGIGLMILSGWSSVNTLKVNIEVQKGYGMYIYSGTYGVEDFRIVSNGSSSYAKNVLGKYLNVMLMEREEIETPEAAALLQGYNFSVLPFGAGDKRYLEVPKNLVIQAPKEVEGSYGIYMMGEYGSLDLYGRGSKEADKVSSIVRIEGNTGIFANADSWMSISSDYDLERFPIVIEGKKEAINIGRVNFYASDIVLQTEETGIKAGDISVYEADIEIEVFGENGKVALESSSFWTYNSSINIDSSGRGIFLLNAEFADFDVSEITVQADDQPVEILLLDNNGSVELRGTQLIATSTQISPDYMDIPAYYANVQTNLEKGYKPIPLDEYGLLRSNPAEIVESSVIELYSSKTSDKIGETPALPYSANGNIDNYENYDWKVSPELNFEVSEEGIFTEEKEENIVFFGTRQGQEDSEINTDKLVFKDQLTKHVVGFVTYSKDGDEDEVNSQFLYTVNFYNCRGELEGQDWVFEGGVANPPKTYTYPTSAMENINSNRDVQPLNCDSQFTIPNTGI